MGGRGAAFSFLNFAGDFNIKVSDTFDEDCFTVKYKDNPLIIKLRQKNILLYASCDNIPEDILFEKLKVIYELSNKYNFTELKNNPLYIREEVYANPFVVEAFRSSMNGRTELLLNKSNEHKTLEKIKQDAKKQVDSGFWQECDDKNLGKYTTSHEMGHYMQYCLTKSRFSQEDFFKKDIARKMYEDIEKIHKKMYNKHIQEKDVSKYGSKNPAEFFAELFAHVNNCDRINNAGKALLKYIKGE